MTTKMITIFYQIVYILSWTEASQEISSLTIPRREGWEVTLSQDVRPHTSGLERFTFCTFLKPEYSRLQSDILLLQIKEFIFDALTLSLDLVQDTLEVGLHKDLRSGWSQAGPHLVLFDTGNLRPRSWLGVCIKMSSKQTVVLTSSDVVLNINLTRTEDSQELAVGL